jgi:hypothetical protein
MSIFGKDFALVVAFLQNLRGGSQPILARASDGLLYVVKFSNNLQGVNLPFNESVGTELYRACGLSVPSWKRLLVTDSFLDQNPDCWMQTPEGRLRPKSGMCFGSRFLGGDGETLLEILPGCSIKRISNRGSFWLAWLIDICALHADNRQALLLQDGNRGIEAFFVDHGHFFGGPKGEQRLHFMASRYLDSRVYQDVSSQHQLNLLKAVRSLDVDGLWRRVQGVPDDWKSESAIEGFEQCLDRLSNYELLRNIVDTMVDANQRGIGSGERKPCAEQWSTVLRIGVQAA